MISHPMNFSFRFPALPGIVPVIGAHGIPEARQMGSDAGAGRASIFF
jgi:hypothetical protein